MFIIRYDSGPFRNHLGLHTPPDKELGRIHPTCTGQASIRVFLGFRGLGEGFYEVYMSGRIWVYRVVECSKGFKYDFAASTPAIAAVTEVCSFLFGSMSLAAALVY